MEFLYHDREPRDSGLLHRKIGRNQWEYWVPSKNAWRKTRVGPQECFNDPSVSYNETWCEPYEGMEND